jgi:hypothetical protein
VISINVNGSSLFYKSPSDKKSSFFYFWFSIMEWNRSSPTDIANCGDPELIPPFLLFCSFPVCSMRIRATSIKEEFFASVACSFISRSTTVGPDETLPDGKDF